MTKIELLNKTHMFFSKANNQMFTINFLVDTDLDNDVTSIFVVDSDGDEYQMDISEIDIANDIFYELTTIDVSQVN